MTNLEIIANEAINHEIYTEEQVNEMIMNGQDLGLNTYAGWKKLGYQVQKGQKARITTKLWKFKKEKTKLPMKDGTEEEQETNNYYLCKAFLFYKDQVEKVN